jgi:integrase
MRYVHEYRDRHGKVRRYFRRGGKKITLPGDPESEEFATAYLKALRGENIIIDSKAKAGSIASAVAGYFVSTPFNNLAPASRAMRRNILERFREKRGALSVATLQPRHIDQILAEKAATPPAQKNLLKTLRAFFDYCISVKLLGDNPTAGAKVSVPKSSGFQTWTEANIAQFAAKHPVGTKARLALDLLLYTGQRRADTILMGRQHIRDGGLYVKQQKTGVELDIPIHPDLQATLEATPSGQLTFLVTSFGKGFTAPGFTNWFREQCQVAGLAKGLSAHGVRKASCRRLAEAGCSAHEIAAISGHATLAEVQRYTKAADQKRMAKSAMKTVEAAFSSKRTQSG